MAEMVPVPENKLYTDIKDNHRMLRGHIPQQRSSISSQEHGIRLRNTGSTVRIPRQGQTYYAPPSGAG